MQPIKKILLTKLHPHPLQKSFYANCSAADDASLAADLRRRGQRDPIIIMPAGNKAGLPPGTILDGHRRARLLAANGETRADVVVRDDLKSASVDEVESEFLHYNFDRRQLDPLSKARVAKKLLEIEQGCPARPGSPEHDQLRDRVGKILGTSGRTVSRHLAVLKAPLAVQQVFQAGLLPVVVAAKVCLLPAAEQAELAAELEGVRDQGMINDSVRKYLTIRNKNRHKKIADAFMTFVRSLQRGLEDLEDRAETIQPKHAVEHIETLNRASKLLTKAIAAVKKAA